MAIHQNRRREALRKYSVFFTGLISARRGTPDLGSVDGFEFLKILASKLPVPLQQQWITKVGKCRDELYRAPTLEDLTKFVNKIARDMKDPRITGLGYQKRNETGPNSKGTVKKNAFTTTVKKDSGQSPPEKNEKTTRTSRPMIPRRKSASCVFIVEVEQNTT